MGLFHRVRHPGLPSSIHEITPKSPHRFYIFGHNTRPISPTRQTIADIPHRKDLTRGRQKVIYIAEFCALVSIVFVILVNIGCVNTSKTLTKIYFIKLDLSHIIPVSVPNAVLVNSIAQSLGLRDFYQVGLWGYCEGYKGQGTTYCSPPKTLYWFDPVTILESQLLAGATIALPSNLESILNIVRIVSHGMFGCFLAGACAMAVNLILGWLPIYSRWWSGLIGTIAFSAAALLIVGSGIATAIFVVFRQVFASQTQFSIGAKIGVEMFVFMWMTAGFALVSFICQAGMCCCFTSKRRMRRKYLAEDDKEKRWTERAMDNIGRSSQSQSRSSPAESVQEKERERERERGIEQLHGQTAPAGGVAMAQTSSMKPPTEVQPVPRSNTFSSTTSSRLSKHNPGRFSSDMARTSIKSKR